ncbi:VWA domain-containing protein [bacterium]|nr:VWA domain-containing protein [bacterium]
MRFANPELLFLLGLVPVFVALEHWQYKRNKKKLRQFSEAIFWQYWVPQWSPWRKQYKVVLVSLAMALMIVALARPQGKPIQKEVLRKKTAIYFVLDCSASMRAQDVTPNRFLAAKTAIREIVSQFPGKQVGLVAFTGQANVMCPATYDHKSFLIALKQIRINALPQPGSNPAAGLVLALKKLGEIDGTAKAVVFFSDGEDNHGKYLVPLAQSEKNQGIKIFCVGLGTLKGARIPLGKDFWGKTQYRKYAGSYVKTRLQALEMRKIAKISGGSYSRWTEGKSDFRKLIVTIRKDSKTIPGTGKIWAYFEYFPWLVFMAFLLLLVEPTISLTGRRRYE